MTAAPWNLVVNSMAGALVGGHLEPGAQGVVSQCAMEHAIGAFVFVPAGALVPVALEALDIG